MTFNYYLKKIVFTSRDVVSGNGSTLLTFSFESSFPVVTSSFNALNFKFLSLRKTKSNTIITHIVYPPSDKI